MGWSTAISTLPTELAESVTWDRGKEMSAHAQGSANDEHQRPVGGTGFGAPAVGARAPGAGREQQPLAAVSCYAQLGFTDVWLGGSHLSAAFFLCAAVVLGVTARHLHSSTRH